LRFFIAVLVFTLSSGDAGRAQTSAGFNRVISPAVVAYWQSHETGAGAGSLDLLVLWRGAPGWFTRGTSSAGGGEMSGGFGKWSAYHWMSYGDLTLMMEFRSDSKDLPPESTTLTVLGRDISLRDANVVLIDGVDTGAPTIAGTERVDPLFLGADPVAAIVKRSPALFDFLRCDAIVSDTQVQTIIESICRQMRP
jgi:hypothetical protein